MAKRIKARGGRRKARRWRACRCRAERVCRRCAAKEAWRTRLTRVHMSKINLPRLRKLVNPHPGWNEVGQRRLYRRAEEARLVAVEDALRTRSRSEATELWGEVAQRLAEINDTHMWLMHDAGDHDLLYEVVCEVVHQIADGQGFEERLLELGQAIWGDAGAPYTPRSRHAKPPEPKRRVKKVRSHGVAPVEQCGGGS